MGTQLAVLLTGVLAAGGPDGGPQVVAAPLPPAILQSVLGCWQQGGERFEIHRTLEGGAQIVRTLAPTDASFDPDYARRAALPQELMYDPTDGSLAFQAAGRIHALLFIFKVTPKGLDGYWASNHGKGYAPTGSTSTLIHCR